MSITKLKPPREWLLRYRDFQSRVFKPKQKQLLWPITTDANNTMNQSELEANACNRRQAREKAC